MMFRCVPGPKFVNHVDMGCRDLAKGVGRRERVSEGQAFRSGNPIIRRRERSLQAALPVLCVQSSYGFLKVMYRKPCPIGSGVSKFLLKQGTDVLN